MLDHVNMTSKDWFEFIRGETESALTLLYSYMGFYDALSDASVVEAANQNPDFWRIHTAALQNTLFIYLGRLSDDSYNGKSFSDFSAHILQNINDYTATSFRLRRPEALKLNPAYLDVAVFPKTADINKLFSLARSPNKLLRAESKIIRSKVVAHAVFTQSHEHSHLFQAVKLSEVEHALLVLDSVVNNLYQTYQNARQLSFEVHAFHEKETIFQDVRRAILGEARPSSVAL
jgi:hypothetical protein